MKKQQYKHVIYRYTGRYQKNQQKQLKWLSQVAGNGGRYTRDGYFFAIRLEELFDDVHICFDKIKTKI